MGLPAPPPINNPPDKRGRMRATVRYNRGQTTGGQMYRRRNRANTTKRCPATFVFSLPLSLSLLLPLPPPRQDARDALAVIQLISRNVDRSAAPSSRSPLGTRALLCNSTRSAHLERINQGSRRTSNVYIERERESAHRATLARLKRTFSKAETFAYIIRSALHHRHLYLIPSATPLALLLSFYLFIFFFSRGHLRE